MKKIWNYYSFHFVLFHLLSFSILLIMGCENNSTEYQSEKNLLLSIKKSSGNAKQLSTVAFQFLRYFASQDGTQRLCQAFNNSNNKRKSVDLRSFYNQIKYKAKNNRVNLDTLLVDKSLKKLPEKLEIYPYWRQISLWNMNFNPKRLAIVYWDSRKGDGTSVSGYVLPEFRPIVLVDHEKLDFPIIVISVPEDYNENESTNIVKNVKSLNSGVGGSETVWKVHFVHIYNDHEPDWAEPPEFYIKAKASNGDWKRTDISPPVVNTSPWWFTKTIYEFGPYRPYWSQLEIWEDDFAAPDDLVESYWFFSGACSKWVDTGSMYERQLIGCNGERGADITVQVTNPD